MASVEMDSDSFAVDSFTVDSSAVESFATSSPRPERPKSRFAQLSPLHIFLLKKSTVNLTLDEPEPDEVDETPKSERWFPAMPNILWHVFGFYVLYLALTARTALLTVLSIILNRIGATRQAAPILALIVVFFLPQRYFGDYDFYEDDVLVIGEDLYRSMMSCCWSLGIVYWLRALCGWRF